MMGASNKGIAMARPIVIHADWDPDAEVWVATTQDIRGLATEADTIEALRAKLPRMILDLLEEQGISDFPASIEIIARSSDRFICRRMRSVAFVHGRFLSRRNPNFDLERISIQTSRTGRSRKSGGIRRPAYRSSSTES